MNNHIVINDQKIPLTDEQVKQILAAYHSTEIELASVAVGEAVKIGKHEMIVLTQTEAGTELICKDFVHERMEFGKNNQYDGSNVDNACNAFAEEIAAAVGEDNVLLHTVDLTADDGLKDYGNVTRRASLLTADMYRHHVETLDRHKSDEWWWLATPHSTATHGNDSWVKCVSPSGRIDYGDFNNDFGVRPFCILKSNIFVSK